MADQSILISEILNAIPQVLCHRNLRDTKEKEHCEMKINKTYIKENDDIISRVSNTEN